MRAQLTRVGWGCFLEMAPAAPHALQSPPLPFASDSEALVHFMLPFLITTHSFTLLFLVTGSKGGYIWACYSIFKHLEKTSPKCCVCFLSLCVCLSASGKRLELPTVMLSCCILLIGIPSWWWWWWWWWYTNTWVMDSSYSWHGCLPKPPDAFLVF